MSLLSRVRKNLKERREKSEKAKHERKEIDREADKKAHEEYLESYKTERFAQARTKARARGKRDASQGSSFGSIGNAGKGGFKMFSNAGQNLIKSGAFDLPTSNMDAILGNSIPKSRKGKKKKKTDMFDLF